MVPRNDEPRYNEDPVITNIVVEQHVKVWQLNYSKICGNKPRYHEIPAITNRF